MFGSSLLSANALLENRHRLLAALRELEAQSATIDYSGGGDSGDISTVAVFPSERMDSLAQAMVVLRCVRGEWRDGHYQPIVEDRSVALSQALEDFTLEWVNSTHGGWENNDGGQGTVTIDVTENTFNLEHTEFYTESTGYEHSL